MRCSEHCGLGKYDSFRLLADVEDTKALRIAGGGGGGGGGKVIAEVGMMNSHSSFFFFFPSHSLTLSLPRCSLYALRPSNIFIAPPTILLFLILPSSPSPLWLYSSSSSPLLLLLLLFSLYFFVMSFIFVCVCCLRSRTFALTVGGVRYTCGSVVVFSPAEGQDGAQRHRHGDGRAYRTGRGDLHRGA